MAVISLDGLSGLLAVHQALAGRPGGDHVQRFAGVRASRGLAVNGDDAGIAVPQRFHPGRETVLEEVTVERIHLVIERIVGRKPGS
jgi:hypothetical protein